MMKPFVVLLLSLLFATPSVAPQQMADPQRNACAYPSMSSKSRNIKVDVTTIPTNDRQTIYKEGEAIDAIVWMTNMGDEPVCVCSSAPLYQNRPLLLKDGKQVPYIPDRIEWIEKYWDSDEPCLEVTRPFEFYELKPHVRTKVDWFVVSEGKQQTGNIKWYSTLGVGHYQLSVARKFDCCAGPEAKSDPFNFEIVEDDFIYSESVNRMSRMTAGARKAFDLAWSALQRDPEIPEKELAAYSIELIEKEGDDSYFFYFHSRSRARFFAEGGSANAAAPVKFGVIGRDAGYWVRKSDYTIPMSFK